jgi:proliferating cell nuclear antigen
MFKVVINAGILKGAIEAISVLVDEGRVKLTKGEMGIKAVDPANVAMVSLSIPSKAFEKYEAKEGEIGLDIKKLNDILEMVENSENVELRVDPEAKKLNISVGDLSCSIGLLDLSHVRKEPSIPSLELPASVVLSGADFRRGTKAAEKIGDSIVLGIENDTFYMEAKGDTDSIKLALPKSKLSEIKSVKVRSSYSLDYLGDISKIAGKSSEVKIELGNDYPVKLSFQIADGKGKIEYMLAPRIESE